MELSEEEKVALKEIKVKYYQIDVLLGLKHVNQ